MTVADGEPLPVSQSFGDANPGPDREGAPCAACGNALVVGDSFCESCGAPTDPNAAVAAGLVSSPSSAEPKIVAPETEGIFDTQPNPIVRICAECSGLIAEDGYCSQCGAKGRTERDHWNEQPVPWVAAVCDRGIRHHRNEDAVALVAVADPGSYAALIVCDGVSSSSNSDVAALAAARAARDELDSLVPAGGASLASRIVAITATIERAGAAAQVAAASTVVTETGPGSSAPACTFVTAVVDEQLIVAGWVGDSRAYWLPDRSAPEMLSVDHSVASEMIHAGVSRSVAEASTDAHAITRWLGVDSPNAVPQCATTTVFGAGWLLVCSDGLWNFCSDAIDMAARINELSAQIAPGDPTTVAPLPLAEAFTKWANDQGGHDNISVVLARIPEPAR